MECVVVVEHFFVRVERCVCVVLFFFCVCLFK